MGAYDEASNVVETHEHKGDSEICVKYPVLTSIHLA
jgi:hypothetical protein